MNLPDGFQLVTLDTADSTNSEALRRSEGGAPDGTIVWALAQSAGRGRQGRAWQSLAGNLTVSFLLRPAIPPARLPELSLLAAVALAETVASLVPADRAVALKWPNDVLLDGAKLAGILLEAPPGGGAVIGIGVNVARCPDSDSIAYPATRLADHAPEVTVAELLEALAWSLFDWLLHWCVGGFAAVRAAWLERGPQDGDRVRIHAGTELLEGAYRGLSDEGGLLLDTGNGIRRILAGDVLPFNSAA
jgi:BirA family transcriptional regulator, biotin operon repressor / biotin---[acetyl-CoA-carboxylase] ligase